MVDVVVDGTSLPKFTLEEYIEYLTAPQWARDGCESESEYHLNTCAKVKEWYDSSEKEYESEKKTWDLCYDSLDATGKKAVSSGMLTEEAIAAARIPILKNAMLDEVSALYGGQYVPVLKHLNDNVAPMIALANQYMRIEFKLNKWESLKFQLGRDGFVTDMFVLKIYTDDESPGPLGEEERIVLDRIDPRNCYFDPKATGSTWASMDFFIVKESLDIGVARNRFKEKAALIDEALAEPDSNKDRTSTSQLLILPGNKRRWNSSHERKRVQIKECWLHDERMQFRAYKEEDGETIKVDEEGFVEGDWERAYPHGRMIVTAADRIVLRDIPNPYWHKGLPFVWASMTPADRLVTVGKAASILGFDRKINDLETRQHSYAQSEIERPMVADLGALPSNIQWYDTKGQSRNILIKTAGKEFVRPLPVETPQFVGPLLQRYMTYKDQTAGQGGILRGEVPEGSTISAETIQNAQGTGMSRMSMQSVMISQAMLEVGFKMFWLQRETYKEGMTATVTMPDGSQKQVTWDSDAPGEWFWVDIDITANTPGGQQARMANAINLKREGIVDRPYVLANSGIDGWEQIDQRMTNREMQEIQAQGFGRSLGVAVKQAQKEDRGPVEKMK